MPHRRQAVYTPWTSLIVMVTDPSWFAAVKDEASNVINRSGTSSLGAAVHSQQMNLALMSSAHAVGG
jgi:hypothetical protein